jgi:hypothetical protein
LINRGVTSVEFDGADQSSDEVLLVDDGKRHEVRVVMGERIKDEGIELLNSEIAQPEEAR